MKRKFAITSDHAGYEMKLFIVNHFREKGYNVTDLGTDSPKDVDYPDFGHRLAGVVEEGQFDTGISICGSGNGINMVTNKHRGIRGALCWNREIARLAREHNDANICSLPARFIEVPEAIEIVGTFLETGFEGGRHKQRVEKIHKNI